VHEISREQQAALLDSAGDIVPDELLGAGVTVALEACHLRGDAGKTSALGDFTLGRRSAALGVTYCGIDAGDGRAVGTREGLEENFA